jgi:hypothetical protein
VRDLALCLGAAGLATLANPYGGEVYRYVGLISGTAAGRPISEWLPPGTHTLTGQLFVASLALVIATLALARQRLATADLVLLLAFLPLACGAVRMVPWWLLVSLPIVAGPLAGLLPPAVRDDPEGDRPTWSAALFCGLLLAVAVASVPLLPPPWSLGHWRTRLHGPRPETHLAAIADWLRAEPGPARRMFCSLELGEYDGFRVFMDGRIEIIPDPIWADYWAIYHARGDWPELLARYDVDFLVLDASDPTQAVGLLPLARQAGWRELARSGAVVLLGRPAVKPR